MAPSIIDAIETTGLLGGIGARSRRGFGGLRLAKLQVDDDFRSQPSDPASYVRALQALLSRWSCAATNPNDVPFSAFSKLNRAFVVRGQSSQADLHDEMGHRLHYFRGYGVLEDEVRRVGGMKVEHPQFKPDHDWFADVNRRIADKRAPTHLDSAPARCIFGLPHAYYKRDQDASKPDYRVTVTGASTDRRASPLLLHIHAFDGGEKPVAVWSVFPCAFLDPQAATARPLQVQRVRLVYNQAKQKKVSDRPRPPPWRVRMQPDYEPIYRFLTPTHVPGLESLGSAPP